MSTRESERIPRPDGPASRDAAPTAWSSEQASFTREVPYLLRVPESSEDPSPAPLVIGLHGMGMSARSFSRRLAPLLESPWALLAPQGPYPFEMRRPDKMRIGHAWYTYRGDEEEWFESMLVTERYLLELIDGVTSRPDIDASRVFLIGFSQGCYLGYFLALRNAARFAGLVSVGGRLKRRFLEPSFAAARDLPVLILHGSRDPSVPLEFAERSRDALTAHQIEATLVQTDSEHDLAPEQVCVAHDWIAERLGRST